VPLLEFRDVQYTYPDGTTALRGVNLTIPEGEYLVLAGPNGAGKSALAKCANGILRPQHGGVTLRGRDIHADLRETRRAVAVMFQSADHQFIAATVEQDVAFGPENRGASPADVDRSVDAALEALQITHLRRQDPLLLSGGEKRRVALAGLLALEPEIIFLDEPFASLDYGGVRSVLAALRTLHGRGIAIVAITHAVEKIAAEANRMVLVHGGRVVADGSPDEVLPMGSSYGLAPESRPVSELSWL
jgi:energy-coupling factor transporter ATP-binding protein EcfA2